MEIGNQEYTVIYTPILQKTLKHKDEYPGHKVVQLDKEHGLMYGNGCLHHNHDNCETCPMSDCDFETSREIKLRIKRRKNMECINES